MHSKARSPTLNSDSYLKAVPFDLEEILRRCEDRVELKVYGIEEVGLNIKVDLVAVLRHKLDEKVVEIISTLLQRNPMCKLSPEDVLFLQKQPLPTQVVKFKVNSSAAFYLEALQVPFYFYDYYYALGGTFEMVQFSQLF